MKQLLRITLLFTLLGNFQVEAQIFKKLGDRLLNKLEKKVENRIEKKADNVTDDALDSVMGDPNKTKKSNATKKKTTANNTSDSNPFATMMQNMGKEVTVEKKYHFHTTITMDQYSNSRSSTTVEQSLGDDAVLTEMSNAKIIIDNKNDATITISEEDKQAQVMSMSILNAFTKNTAENDENSTAPKITKKSGTKNIIGYPCKNALVEHDGMTIDLWYTNAVNIDTSVLMDFAGKMSGNSKNALNFFAEKDLGFVMQMDVKMPEDNINFGTTVKKIEKKSITITMSDYEITKI